MPSDQHRRRPGDPSRLRQSSGYRDAVLSVKYGAVGGPAMQQQRGYGSDCGGSNGGGGGDRNGVDCVVDKSCGGSTAPTNRSRPRPRLWADNPFVTKKKKRKARDDDVADYGNDEDVVSSEGGKKVGKRSKQRGSPLSPSCTANVGRASAASRVRKSDDAEKSANSDTTTTGKRRVHFSSALISNVYTRPRTLPENVRALFYSKKDEQRFRADYVEWQRCGGCDDEEESDLDSPDTEDEWPMDEKDEVMDLQDDKDCTTPDASDEDVEEEGGDDDENVDEESSAPSEEDDDSSSTETEIDSDDEEDELDDGEEPEPSPTKISVHGRQDVPSVEDTSGSSSDSEDGDDDDA